MTLFWIINCHSIMNEMPDCYLIIFAENLCLIWFLLSNICNVIIVFVVKAQVSISAQHLQDTGPPREILQGGTRASWKSNYHMIATTRAPRCTRKEGHDSDNNIRNITVIVVVVVVVDGYWTIFKFVSLFIVVLYIYNICFICPT